MWQSVTRNLDNATVFFHEWRFLSPARRAQIAAQRDEYEALFRGVIAGRHRRRASFPAPTRVWAPLLVLSAGNWLYQWFRPDGALPPRPSPRRWPTWSSPGCAAWAPANAKRRTIQDGLGARRKRDERARCQSGTQLQNPSRGCRRA